VAESDYAAGFPCQCALESIKEIPISPVHNNPGHSVIKEKIDPSQKPEKKDSEYGNSGFQNLDIRRSFGNWYFI